MHETLLRILKEWIGGLVTTRETRERLKSLREELAQSKD